MTPSTPSRLSGSRLGAVGVCLASLVLLYGASFFTRDWRTVVPQPGSVATEALFTRAKPALHPTENLAESAAEAPARPDPDVTGSLPKLAEPESAASAAPPAAEPPLAVTAAPKPAPPRARAQRKAPQPTQVAAAPPAPAASVPAAVPVQFGLAERGN